MIKAIAAGRAGDVRLAGVADRPEAEERLRQIALDRHVPVTTGVGTLLRFHPEIVVEAASPDALRTHAVSILTAGADLLAMSVGAFADDGFTRSVRDAARRAGRRVVIPSGAIGGLDAVAAACLARVDEVWLETSKPPTALEGAPFVVESHLDLTGLTQRTVIFAGNVADATRGFPANTNVAAALGLAAAPCPVRVRVVADPALRRNVHEIRAVGEFGEMSLRFENTPSANPRTSLLACLGALAALRSMTEPLVVL